MKAKKLSAKWIGIMAAVLALIMLAVFLLMRSQKSENSYRSIQIYELQGSATIEREGIGVLDAIENLYLKSGDRIVVEADSFLRLKLDDDKYIMVEENSKLSIVASGTKENSKTTIHLEEGAITNEIQNKLNESSTYEVTTPNSVMAVRGTVFRVEVIFDEKQEVYTRVSTFDGKVDAKAVYSDGRVEEKAVPIEAGKETIIHFKEEESGYEIELKEIDYEALPVQALESLKEVLDHDTALTGMETESLSALIEEKKEEAKDGENEPNEKPEEGGSGEESTKTEEVQNAEKPDKAPAVTTEEAKDSREEGTKEEPTEEITTQVKEVDTYTVSFLYQGRVFGTQQVEEGQRVSVPKLAPDKTGSWNFDFSTPISKDLTIEWN